MDKKRLITAARSYVSSHPEEVLRAVKNAALLRFGLPLDVLRWAAKQTASKKAPRDVEIEAVPPGLKLSATINLMGAVVRASAQVFIERVTINAEQARIEVRLADVQLKLLEDSDSPVAALLKSGALDLSKPGNLVAYMPKRPALLVEAVDDRIVLDLMQHPALRSKPALSKALGLLTPVFTVTAIETDPEHLDLVCAAFENGLSGALQSMREQL